MKLKPVKWRKRWLSDRSGCWEEAKLGIFVLCASEDVWWIMPVNLWGNLVHGECRSAEDGKRKAKAWLTKRIKEVVNV